MNQDNQQLDINEILTSLKTTIGDQALEIAMLKASVAALAKVQNEEPTTTE